MSLGSVSAGEQISIGLGNNPDGTEQATIGVANQQRQTPEQITPDLHPTTQQQIILNLFNSTSSALSPGNALRLV